MSSSPVAGPSGLTAPAALDPGARVVNPHRASSTGLVFDDMLARTLGAGDDGSAGAQISADEAFAIQRRLRGDLASILSTALGDSASGAGPIDSPAAAAQRRWRAFFDLLPADVRDAFTAADALAPEQAEALATIAAAPGPEAPARFWEHTPEAIRDKLAALDESTQALLANFLTRQTDAVNGQGYSFLGDGTMGLLQSGLPGSLNGPPPGPDWDGSRVEGLVNTQGQIIRIGVTANCTPADHRYWIHSPRYGTNPVQAYLFPDGDWRTAPPPPPLGEGTSARKPPVAREVTADA